MDKLFLMFRMAVYTLAIPVAGYLGGTFDAATGDLTINVYDIADLLWGIGAAALTYGVGRVSKANGGAT